MKPIIAGQFDTFDDWVNRASRVISERHCPTDTVGNVLRAICVDTRGRRCQCGGDFMRARDEGTFPVRFFWEFEPTYPPVAISDKLLESVYHCKGDGWFTYAPAHGRIAGKLLRLGHVERSYDHHGRGWLKMTAAGIKFFEDRYGKLRDV